MILANTTTYTGRSLDTETGLYYYRNRYYHAQLGRFVSRDPIGYDGSKWNLYEYVNSMAVNTVDPLGLARRGGIMGDHSPITLPVVAGGLIDKKLRQYDPGYIIGPDADPCTEQLAIDSAHCSALWAQCVREREVPYSIFNRCTGRYQERVDECLAVEKNCLDKAKKKYERCVSARGKPPRGVPPRIDPALVPDPFRWQPWPTPPPNHSVPINWGE